MTESSVEYVTHTDTCLVGRDQLVEQQLSVLVEVREARARFQCAGCGAATEWVNVVLPGGFEA